MSQFFQFTLIALLVNDFVLLAVNRLPTMVKMVVVQGVLLAALLLTSSADISTEVFILAFAIVVVKGVMLPMLLTRTRKSTYHDPVMRPYLGHGLSVLAGMLGLVFSLWLEAHLPAELGVFPPLLLPAALTTLFIGLILIVTRSRTLAQIIGYLAAENGIFLLGVPLMEHGALWFELALLLDMCVAVLVMGVAMGHINDTFDTTNSDYFCNLHD